jgi:acetyl-CoA carboxylase carboxyl transferase subunit beta
VTKRTELKDELVTIVRLLMRQDPAVKGDLPAPEIKPEATEETAAAEEEAK